MLGAAGSAFLFISTLIFTVIVGIFVLALAVHHYFVVVLGTANGSDEVPWPDEPIYDWLIQVVHFGWASMLWLVPVGLLFRAAERDFFPEDTMVRFGLLAAVGSWLLLPIGLLSALGGRSPWLIVRPGLFLQLARLFPSVSVFYFCTGLLLLGNAFLWYLAVCTPAGILLPVAAVVGGAVVLIHARLLGRLALLMRRLRPLSSQTISKVTRKPKPTRKRKRAKRLRGVQSRDPWAVPDPTESTEKPRTPEEAYGVVDQGPANVPDFYSQPEEPGVPSPQGKEEEVPEVPEETYEVADGRKRESTAGVQAGKPQSTTPAAEPSPALARELAMIRKPAPRPPKFPLFNGVWSFPWYSTSLRAWISLCCGALVLGAGLRGVRIFWPF